MLDHASIPLRKPDRVVRLVVGDAEIMDRSGEEKGRSAPIGIELVNAAIIVIDRVVVSPVRGTVPESGTGQGEGEIEAGVHTGERVLGTNGDDSVQETSH